MKNSAPTISRFQSGALLAELAISLPLLLLITTALLNLGQWAWERQTIQTRITAAMREAALASYLTYETPSCHTIEADAGTRITSAMHDTLKGRASRWRVSAPLTGNEQRGIYSTQVLRVRLFYGSYVDSQENCIFCLPNFLNSFNNTFLLSVPLDLGCS